MKIKKRKKATRFRGTHTHGRGFKKKARGSGHRGGVGMAGSGKRADQKKTLVLNLFGNDYFGKDKARRRKLTIKLKQINVGDIEANISSFIKNGTAKQTKSGEYEITLNDYKILGDGEIKSKMKIHAAKASPSAVDKINSAGGEIVLKSSSKKE